MTQRYAPRISNASELHRLAEALWAERSPLRKGRCADPQTLIHELGVQRLELELKNGDLSAAYNEIWRILERYTELYDFAPVAYFTFLTNGRIGEANFAAASLVGKERSQLIGASVFDFVEEAHLGRVQTFLQEIGRTPSSCRQLEFGLRRTDGTTLHVRLNGVCGDFVPNQGRSVRVALIDVTEQEGTRTALLAERDLEMSYFDSAAVFMMVLDPEGRIARVNRKGLELLHGSDEKELLGRDWFSDCLPERTGRKVREGFADMMRGTGGDHRRHETQVLCLDGSKRLMAFRESVLRDARSQIIGLVSVGEGLDSPPRSQSKA